MDNSYVDHQKVQRIEQLMNREIKIAEIKLKREESLLAHEMAVQELTLQHMKRMHDLEYREIETKIRLTEVQLQAQKSNHN